MTLFLVQLNSLIYANTVSIDPETFLQSVLKAEKDPSFIDRDVTGDGSQFVNFRAKALDHDGIKVVLQKAFNSDVQAPIRFSIIQMNMSCSRQTIQRTFYFFNANGKLLTMKEQETSELALETALGKVVCSVK